tara:strand:- start:2669 stop:5119 length:2451 start_codon:yes stop_codon:yes gene_type:complete
MTDNYLATAWNIRLRKPMNVDKAVELRETDPFYKPGDYWCHKDCYNSNPRKGIAVSPSKSHTRTYQNGVTVDVRGCFKQSQHSSNSCGVREKSRRKREDRNKSRMFFTQFTGNLRDYLNGDIQYTSMLAAHQVRDFFNIESISEPRPENKPDFTIQHSGINPEREETHIVIINQNRSRTRFFQNDEFHPLNTITIRVTDWQQADIDDFDGYGAKVFHDAWEQLQIRIQERVEYERLKKQERERLERDRQIAKAKDYSIDLLRYLGITTDGMMPEDVIQLYTENSMELERLIFEHNRAEEEKAKKEEEEKRKAEIEREQELSKRAAILKEARKIMRKWRYPHPNRVFNTETKEVIETDLVRLEALMEFEAIYDWEQGIKQWEDRTNSEEEDVVSSIPSEVSLSETQFHQLISDCNDLITRVEQARENKEREDAILLEVELENQKTKNLTASGIKETDKEKEERVKREKSESDHREWRKMMEEKRIQRAQESEIRERALKIKKKYESEYRKLTQLNTDTKKIIGVWTGKETFYRSFQYARYRTDRKSRVRYDPNLSISKLNSPSFMGFNRQYYESEISSYEERINSWSLNAAALDQILRINNEHHNNTMRLEDRRVMEMRDEILKANREAVELKDAYEAGISDYITKLNELSSLETKQTNLISELSGNQIWLNESKASEALKEGTTFLEDLQNQLKTVWSELVSQGISLAEDLVHLSTGRIANLNYWDHWPILKDHWIHLFENTEGIGRGRITHYDQKKGFGFVLQKTGWRTNRQVFFHKSTLDFDPSLNTDVIFIVTEKNPKGPSARILLEEHCIHY